MCKEIERRKEPRYPLQGLDIYSINNGKYIGKSVDMSVCGMYIKSPFNFVKDSKILISFKISPTEPSFKIYCKILRVIPLDNSGNLIGLEFMLISSSDRNRVLDHLKNDLKLIKRKSKRYINSDYYSLANFIDKDSKDIFEKAHDLYDFLTDAEEKGHQSYYRLLTSASKNKVLIHDDFTDTEKEMVMMASNNYLGLSAHPEVIKAGEEALRKYGSSTGASSVLAGEFDIHKKLEIKIAKMLECEDAYIFVSGYATNIGCIPALVRKNDVAILDKLVHASILDGAVSSMGSFRTFKHNDMNDLERILKSTSEKYEGKLIIVDSVYSMEGDIAPLPEIYSLAKKYNARLMIDEAHGFGVYGDSFAGINDYFDMKGEIDIVMGTLSKTLGCLGGFVASNKEIIEYLRYYARSGFFTTALSPSIVASALRAIEIIEENPELVKKLHSNIDYMTKNLKNMGFNIGNTQSMIIPVIIGDDLIIRKINKYLHEKGVFANAIPYPAVPKGTERIRLSVMATHTKEDLDLTLTSLEEAGKKFGVIGDKTKKSLDNAVA